MRYLTCKRVRIPHRAPSIIMKLFFPRTIQKNSYVAVSGGVDSIVLLREIVCAGKAPKIVHFVHDDEYAKTELEFVTKLAEEYQLELVVGHQSRMTITGSKEKIWRDERYKFFHSLDAKVYIGTNLDDAVEWYLMTCLRGEGHFMEYANKNVEKPLMLTSKSDMYKYVNCHGLSWIEDPSNHDSSGLRSKVRNELVPVVNKIDSGLSGMVRKNLIRKMNLRV